MRDLPFPKKTKVSKVKKASGNVVSQRRQLLQGFLQGLMLGTQPMVSPVLWEDVGRVLYAFLTGESDLDDRQDMRGTYVG